MQVYISSWINPSLLSALKSLAIIIRLKLDIDQDQASTTYTITHHISIKLNHVIMTSRTVYIPNMVGGQAIQVEMSDSDYSISVSSLSSRGLVFESSQTPSLIRRPSAADSIISNSSAESDFMEED
jgi:hypothetical protein